jgi:hypothetical protein
MNKRIGTVAKFVFTAGLLAVAAEAGVPLNGLQGNGGVAFNPLAYTAGTYAEGEKGGLGEWVSKPQVGAWYVNLDDADINWYAAGTAFSIAKRLELSYGYGFIDAQNVDSSINTHNLGAKFKFLDENYGDTVWVPALAAGGLWKYTDTDAVDALGTDDNGFDAYLVATKLITQTPVPVLLSGGLLYSDEVVNGVLGHGDYDTVFFGNVDVLPAKNVAVGIEYKQGVDAGAIQNSDYWNGHVAWFVTDKLTLVAAYVDTGDETKGPTDLGVGSGIVLSAQYAF